MQNVLLRYNQGDNTDENWSRAASDLQSAIVGGGTEIVLRSRSGRGDRNHIIIK